MTRRTIKHSKNEPKEEWARIYVDDGRDSVKAVSLLQARGYPVHSLRVAGNHGPRLLLGRHVLDGLAEIRRFLGKAR
jgi:hypothetical protein